MKIGVLDDYQKCAADLADWSTVLKRAELRFFHEPFASEADLVTELAPFDVLCLNRERTPFPARVLKGSPISSISC